MVCKNYATPANWAMAILVPRISIGNIQRSQSWGKIENSLAVSGIPTVVTYKRGTQ